MKKKKPSIGTLLARYRDPLKPGSLGGLTRFAKANGIMIKRAHEVLERDLGYKLHKHHNGLVSPPHLWLFLESMNSGRRI